MNNPETELAAPTLAELNAAMQPIRQTLSHDGYDVRVLSAADGTAVFEIQASGEVCAECLAPDDVMAPLFLRQLEKAGIRLAAAEIRRPVPRTTTGSDVTREPSPSDDGLQAASPAHDPALRVRESA